MGRFRPARLSPLLAGWQERNPLEGYVSRS